MDKFKGYRTYIFLLLALIVLVLAGVGVIKTSEDILNKIVLGLFAAAGVFLRASEKK